MTFWEHLDELRGRLLRILIAVVLAGVVAFCFKDAVFSVVLAPMEPAFVTNRLVESLSGKQLDGVGGLINVELAQQFLTHMKVSLMAGVLLVSPYVIYLLFGFVWPALYRQERRFALAAVVGGYVMFLAGVALNYFVVFPFTYRFLASYQVSGDVVNMISLKSYISMLLTLSLVMGVMFELPVLSWLLSKTGLLTADLMSKVRRHAIVVILVLAAVITPTGDPVTLTIVALPVYLLYEASILIVRLSGRKKKSETVNVEIQ